MPDEFNRSDRAFTSDVNRFVEIILRSFLVVVMFVGAHICNKMTVIRNYIVLRSGFNLGDGNFHFAQHLRNFFKLISPLISEYHPALCTGHFHLHCGRHGPICRVHNNPAPAILFLQWPIPFWWVHQQCKINRRDFR